MSKLVLRIVRHYVVAPLSTIIALAICLMIAPVQAHIGVQPLFCVLVPHFKDDYWLSVGFGLEQEAKRQNVALLFFEAGGYQARAAQINQLEACIAHSADAILIGAVSSDHPDLTNAIAGVAQHVPVCGLVNALHSDALSGRIGVDWQDMGAVAGGYLRQLHPAGSPPKTAVFLTGPVEAGWTGPLEAGLRRSLSDSSIQIQEVFHADTGVRAQLSLVETALLRHPDADYLIGDAPAIEAALGLFATQAYPDPPQLLSTYVNHAVLRGLMNGQVLATAFDDPVEQGISAIQQAIHATTSPKLKSSIGPKVVLLTRGDQNFNHIRLSPADYFPAIQ